MSFSILATPEAEQRRLSAVRVKPFEYTPDLFESLQARFTQGFTNSTLVAALDLLERPSQGDEELLSVKELHARYPDVLWSEPLTERQAEWAWTRKVRQNHLQETLSEREQGFLASASGFATELVAGAAFSPETYVAPVIGRVSSSAAKLVGSASGRTGAFQRAAAALKTDKYFLAGFAEDAALTAVVSEPIFAKREELLGNPYTAVDYFANVALSGALSGVLNSAGSRVLDSLAFRSELEYATREMSSLLTGKPDGAISPQLRAQLRSEVAVTSSVGQWKARSGFQGDVRLVHKPGIPFVSGIDPETGHITLNTAKAIKPPQVRAALNKALDTPVLDMPRARTKVGDNGLEAVEGTRWRKAPEPENLPEQHPHVQYNLSDPEPGIVDTVSARLENMSARYWNGDPSAVSTEVVAEQFARAQVPFTVPHPDAPVVSLDAEAVKDLSKEALALMDIQGKAIGVQKKAHKDRVAVLKQPDLLEEAEVVEKALRGTQLSRGEVVRAFRSNPAEGEALLAREYERLVKQQVHNDVLQRASDQQVSAKAAAGANHVHEMLSGSLEAGVKDRTGHGDNVWRRQQVETATYANLAHNSFIQSGVEKHLTHYSKDAQAFFSNIERALDGQAGVDAQAAAVAKTLGTILESQRSRLNASGAAGINKLKGFFLRTSHNRSRIVGNKEKWTEHLLRPGVLDWARMGMDDYNLSARRKFLDVVYDEIKDDFGSVLDLDVETQGGAKGRTFAHGRELHFVPGQQTLYNDAFGDSNTARALMDQIELRAKAIALTETLGPNFKKTWQTIEDTLVRSKAKGITDPDDLSRVREAYKATREYKDLKNHFDEITGEANSVVNKRIAAFGEGWRNLVNAQALSGSGITVALSDPIAQVINLRSSGLSRSLASAARHVFDSYSAGIRSVILKNPSEAEKRLAALVLPHDTNLMAARNVLGDSSASLGKNLPGTLSTATIKYSGMGIFTKLSQMTTAITTQRRLASNILEGNTSPDFEQFLKRFDIGQADLDAVSKYILGDQLDIFSIEPEKLRNKFRNLLSESVTVGSLQADPRATALVHGVPTYLGMTNKKGTLPREISDSVTQYFGSALAVHQRLLMRMAILGGGDARFMSLVHRSRIAETVTVAGMMLGSAIAITSVKDILRNKEPAFVGDKPLDPEHMFRLLQVSGIAPLITETISTVKGGNVLWQQLGQYKKVADSAFEGDLWNTVYQAKRLSPFVATNIGPMPGILDSLIGYTSEEYLKDTISRQRVVEQISGQGRLIDF